MSKTVLLIENNDDDAFFMQRIFRKYPEFSLKVLPNGEETIRYLRGEGDYQDRKQHPLPHLVFLDLRLECLHGFEVLGWIRSQHHFYHLKVIILTSYIDILDQEKAEIFGAPCLIKPPTQEMIRMVIRSLEKIPE